MYRLTTYIEIGESPQMLVFDYVTQVQVNSSIETLTDTCSITFPRNLNFKEKNLRDLIPQGAKVSVSIGYDGNNENVFNGYVRTVKTGVPVVIECEDAMYKLKRVRVANETFDNLIVSDFLTTYLPAGIQFSIPGGVSLGKYRIENEPSLAKVLEEFKEKYYLKFFFRSGILYGVLPSTMAAAAGISTHKFKFEYNVVQDNIELKVTDDSSIIVKAKAILKDNSVIEVQEPENGSEGNILCYLSPSATTEQELRIFAREQLQAHKPEGLSGSITVFGEPYILVADHITLYDDRNPERNEKTYMVKGVRRTFGASGYRQDVELGILISDGN